MSKSVRQAHSKAEPNWFHKGSDIVLETMRLKEVVEEHLFRGALVDNSADSASREGVNENLEEHLGHELAALSSKEKTLIQ